MGGSGQTDDGFNYSAVLLSTVSSIKITVLRMTKNSEQDFT